MPNEFDMFCWCGKQYNRLDRAMAEEHGMETDLMFVGREDDEDQ